jgi:hypothetical protein
MKRKICPVCGKEYTERRRNKKGARSWFYRHFGYDGAKWCKEKKK